MAKGIILAGGSGTRLDPLTRVASKQLLPVYDKPMVFYPLALLMRCGFREILVITAPEWQESYFALLGDGSEWGMSIDYCLQDKPTGIPEAWILAEDWLAGDSSCLVLGDNLFFGNLDSIRATVLDEKKQGGTIFAIPTMAPERFGIVTLEDHEGEEKVVKIEEKPSKPSSNLAILGLYFFDRSASRRAKSLQPSERGETEVCSLMESYRKDGLLHCQRLGRGFVWLDAGTPDGLLEAGNFVESLEKRTGYQIACPEEIAWREGWIGDDALEELAKKQRNLDREAYFLNLLKES